MTETEGQKAKEMQGNEIGLKTEKHGKPQDQNHGMIKQSPGGTFRGEGGKKKAQEVRDEPSGTQLDNRPNIRWKAVWKKKKGRAAQKSVADQKIATRLHHGRGEGGGFLHEKRERSAPKGFWHTKR